LNYTRESLRAHALSIEVRALSILSDSPGRREVNGRAES